MKFRLSESDFLALAACAADEDAFGGTVDTHALEVVVNGFCLSGRDNHVIYGCAVVVTGGEFDSGFPVFIALIPVAVVITEHREEQTRLYECEGAVFISAIILEFVNLLDVKTCIEEVLGI